MNTPARRLFAVFWWLLVLGAVAAVLWKVQLERADYQTYKRDEAAYFAKHPATYTNGVREFDPNGPFRIADEHPFEDLADASPSAILWFLAPYIAILLLPYTTMTIIRWIATGRWRFGPRW